MSAEKFWAVFLYCREKKEEFSGNNEIRDLLINIGSTCILCRKYAGSGNYKWERELISTVDMYSDRYSEFRPMGIEIFEIINGD